jgi:hypothetical protein
VCVKLVLGLVVCVDLLARVWLAWPSSFLSLDMWRIKVEVLLSFELWSWRCQFKLLAMLKDFCLMKNIFWLVIRYSLLIFFRTCNKIFVSIFFLVIFIMFKTWCCYVIIYKIRIFKPFGEFVKLTFILSRVEC